MNSEKRNGGINLKRLFIFISFFIVCIILILVLLNQSGLLYKIINYSDLKNEANIDAEIESFVDVDTNKYDYISYNDQGLFNSDDIDYRKRYAFDNLEFFYQYDEFTKAKLENSLDEYYDNNKTFIDSLLRDIYIISDNSDFTFDGVNICAFSNGDKKLSRTIYDLLLNDGDKEFSKCNNIVMLLKDTSQLDIDDFMKSYNMLSSRLSTNNHNVKIYICSKNASMTSNALKEYFKGQLIDLNDLSSADSILYIGFYVNFIRLRESEFVRKKHITEDDIEETEDNEVYLTFDDGTASYTKDLIEIFKKYDVKATFFVTSTNKSVTYALEALKNEGHVIGAHSFKHNYNIYKSKERYFDDLYKIECVIRREIGEFSKLIRFPGGSANQSSRQYNDGIMKELVVDVEDLGYIYYDWNVTSGDGGELSSEITLANILRGIKSPTNKHIVLMHETKKNTVDIVEPLVQYLIENGYKILPLKENTLICHQSILY